jgi:hypothetical protein
MAGARAWPEANRTGGGPAIGIRRSKRPGSASAARTSASHLATEALAGRISMFELARVMGISAKMIDRTYGHLARDSEDAIHARLDARADRSGVVVASEGE